MATMVHPFSLVGGGSYCLILFLYTYATLLSIPLPSVKSLQPAIDYSHTCHDVDVDTMECQSPLSRDPSTMASTITTVTARVRWQWDPGIRVRRQWEPAIDPLCHCVSPTVATEAAVRWFALSVRNATCRRDAFGDQVPSLFQYSHPVLSRPTVPNIDT